MFEYQKFNRYFAQATGNSEELCVGELEKLGAENIKKAYRGVYFNAEPATLYKVNYMSRMLIRVLAPLITFACHSTKYLTKTASTVDWEKILTLDTTFAISASVSNSNITHSLYAAQCLKDGIADYFNDKYGRRPSVDTNNPDVRLNLHIESNKAIVSLDTSGESLHKRGYRKTSGLAPMQEVLAAVLIEISGWDGKKPLWDCMCGSGTIICEALMRYCNIPAQYLRKQFGFFNMPEFQKDEWNKVRVACDAEMRPLPEGIIWGSDKSEKAIVMAKENLSLLPYYEAVSLVTRQFQESPNYEDGIIVTNPPYGIRLGSSEEVKILYKIMGDFIKKKCLGTSAYIYVGDPTLRKSIGLKPTKRHALANGPLQGELVQIDSYRVAFRNKKKPEGK